VVGQKRPVSVSYTLLSCIDSETGGDRSKEDRVQFIRQMLLDHPTWIRTVVFEKYSTIYST